MCGFRHIKIECANGKSSQFTKKLGFYSLSDSSFAIITDSLMAYFSIE